MFAEYEPDNKLRGGTRTLVLRPIEGAQTKSSTGIVDNRLFKGENSLRAIMDPQTCLWSFKYDVGAVPEPLRNQQFTSFAKAYEHAKKYFTTRGVQIVEVKD